MPVILGQCGIVVKLQAIKLSGIVIPTTRITPWGHLQSCFHNAMRLIHTEVHRHDNQHKKHRFNISLNNSTDRISRQPSWTARSRSILSQYFSLYCCFTCSKHTRQHTTVKTTDIHDVLFTKWNMWLNSLNFHFISLLCQNFSVVVPGTSKDDLGV